MCLRTDAYHIYLTYTHMRKFEYPIKFHWDKEVRPFWPDHFSIFSVGGSEYETSIQPAYHYFHSKFDTELKPAV